jgi:hypothetical protein
MDTKIFGKSNAGFFYEGHGTILNPHNSAK